jgi:DNA-binding response OmpR family regulator
MANETILVVEDEVLVGEEIREELERFGYRVPDIIVKGEAVAEAVSRYRPALILMDIRIGGEIDGIDAAAKVKSMEDIPIIYLTAYSDQETLARAADTDPDAYLLKPFSERELMANVAMSLSRRGPPRASFASSSPSWLSYRCRNPGGHRRADQVREPPGHHGNGAVRS